MQAITLEFLNAWITVMKYSYIYFSPVVFLQRVLFFGEQGLF